MPYTPTLWVDDSSPDLHAENLIKIEARIQAPPVHQRRVDVRR